MMASKCALVERANVVFALAPVTPSSSSPAYVSAKYYDRTAIVIAVENTTNTVTGCAISLKQATDVSATGEKELAFSNVWVNVTAGTNDLFTKTAVTSNTFTTTTTTSAKALYIIDLKNSSLDVSNGFDCFRVATEDATATTVSVYYIMEGARLPDATMKSALVD